MSGRVTHGYNPGPKPYLSQTEEKDLADFLVKTSKAGYGKSQQQIKGLATLAMRDKKDWKSEKKLTNGWYYRFMGRQEHLALRKGDPTANVRMDCLSKKVMEDYFEKLKKNLEENNLMNSPAQIYNVDESGMPLDHQPPKVVALKGHINCHSLCKCNRTCTTSICHF